MGLLTDRMLKTAHCDVAGGGPGTSTSAGLVVKRYWTRLSQLSGAVKQLSTEVKQFYHWNIVNTFIIQTYFI